MQLNKSEACSIIWLAVYITMFFSRLVGKSKILKWDILRTCEKWGTDVCECWQNESIHIHIEAKSLSGVLSKTVETASNTFHTVFPAQVFYKLYHPTWLQASGTYLCMETQVGIQYIPIRRIQLGPAAEIQDDLITWPQGQQQIEATPLWGLNLVLLYRKLITFIRSNCDLPDLRQRSSEISARYSVNKMSIGTRSKK